MWLNLLLLVLMSIHNAVSESCFINGTLRLVQTRSITLGNAGRVEICIGGVWGTIAADSIATPWSEKNAQVACIQLGFSGALNAIFQTTVPLTEHADASVPVHLIGVECIGVEHSITQCLHRAINFAFYHENDAYVVCRPNRTIRYSDIHRGGVQSGDIRLFGSKIDSMGAIQIYSSTYGWQGICPDSSWTNSDAATICRDLGYAGGFVVSPIGSSMGPGGEPVSRRLYNATCPGESGSRSMFGVCSFNVGTSNNSNCDQPPGRYASLNCSQIGSRSVRLIGGKDSREGIVEIVYDGRWGMLCDDRFFRSEAQAICQGLGYGRDGASVLQLSPYSVILDSESNLRPIWLTRLACISTDDHLYECVHSTDIIGYANCSGSNIAAVNCSDRDPPGLTGIQIFWTVFAPLLFLLAITCPLIFVYGPGCWKKRHTYDWYNTFTTPSSWCDCDCDCFSSCTPSSWCGCCSNRSTRQHPRRPPVTTETAENTRTFDFHCWNSEPPRIYTVTSVAAGYSVNARAPDLASCNPGPETVSEPSDSGLSKAPPPSYQAAANFPSTDLPPPYPGKPDPPPIQLATFESFSHSPMSTAPMHVAVDQHPTNETDSSYPPPPQPGVDYQGYLFPPYPSGPPLSTTGLPCPSDSSVSSTAANPAHPPVSIRITEV